MLTSKEIKKLQPKNKRYQITIQAGLALRVQRSGVKSWILRVPQNGRMVDITLGHYPLYLLVVLCEHREFYLRYSERPNNYGTGVGLATNNNGQFIYSGWSGALTPKNNAWSGYERQPDQTNRDFGTEFELNFSKGNAIYSDSVSTVQVSAIFGLNLIKAF